MRLAKCNCRHCGKPYTALLSYSSYRPPKDQYEGNSEYCGGCLAAITAALARIPISHRLDFVPAPEVAPWPKASEGEVVMTLHRLGGPAMEHKGQHYLDRKTGKVYRQEFVRVQDYPTDPELYKSDYPAIRREDIQPHSMEPPSDMLYFMRYNYGSEEKKI